MNCIYHKYGILIDTQTPRERAFFMNAESRTYVHVAVAKAHVFLLDVRAYDTSPSRVSRVSFY